MKWILFEINHFEKRSLQKWVTPNSTSSKIIYIENGSKSIISKLARFGKWATSKMFQFETYRRPPQVMQMLKKRINAIFAKNNLGFTLFSLPDCTSNKSWNELHKLARPGFTIPPLTQPARFFILLNKFNYL